MIEKLVGLLPDSVKGLSETLMPSPPPPRVPIRSVFFEYMPTQFLAAAQGQSRSPSQLCLIVCTDKGLEIWALADHRRFQRVYRHSESGLHMAHYVPLDPADLRQPKSGTISEYLYSAVPVLAIAKKTDEYSRALGIHLFSIRNAKYFHVLRFAAPLASFSVTPHAIVAAFHGGQLRVFDLRTLEQRLVLDTLFLSKEMREVAAAPESGAGGLADLVREVVPAFDATSHLLAFVRRDIVSQGKLGGLARGVLGTQLIQDHSFAKETAQRLFALGELGYNKVLNIVNTRKAANITTDPNAGFEFLSFPGEETIQAGTTEGDSEEETSTPAGPDLKAGEAEEENEFVDVTPTGTPGSFVPPDTNTVTIVVQRLEDSSPVATMVPPYFRDVSLLRFSPSATLLLAANEGGQQFYVYRLFPEAGTRHMRSCRSATLLYSIFRGYTSAVICSAEFSLCERWLTITSAKGTSHVYRLDDELQHINAPVAQNPAGATHVLNLTAFGRFRHDSSQGAPWPVTAVLNSYPCSRLGTRKSSAGGEEVPVLVSFTRRAEVYTNSLVVARAAGRTEDPAGPAYGKKEYEMLRGQALPTCGNYFNDKLTIEPLARFGLALGTTKAEENLLLSAKEHKKAATAAPEKALPTEAETLRTSQKRWLSEIVSTNCSMATPSLRICPQFSFCAWEEAPPQDEEGLLTSEPGYRRLDESQGERCDVTAVMRDIFRPAAGSSKSQRGGLNLGIGEAKEGSNSNPFYDGEEEDKELEKRLTKAMNTSISAIAADKDAEGEPEQRSQIFQNGINVLDDYDPKKKGEESTAEKSECE